MTKTKPTKHKEENTFKFQTFSERLSSINVNIVHRVDLKRNNVPEETETFFYECLEKWVDLNCTEGYTKFCKTLGKDVQSLAQLLHHQDRVTDLLFEHILPENVLFLEPILELVVAVAKDLQSDFYPKFTSFFARLVDLLQTKEPEIIEWTFTTLAFLYKYQWRALVKDIERVYDLQLPLLASDKPEHVQLFASESFAFIGRKISNKESFVNLVFSKLHSNPRDSQGVGQLLFQVVKGVKCQFHSNIDVYLPLYLKAVADMTECVENYSIFKAVEHCFLLMARHTNASFAGQSWKLLLKELGVAKKPGKFIGALLLLCQWLTFREGALIGDNVAIANTLAALIEVQLDEEEQTTASEAVASLMLCTKTKLPLEQLSRLGRLIYSCRWTPKAVLAFSAQVVGHELFESHLLSHYLSYCHSITKANAEAHGEVLESLSRLIAAKSSFPKSGHEMADHKLYPMEFTFAMRKSQDTSSVPSIIEGILKKRLEPMICDEFPLFVSALVCLPHVRPVDKASAKTLLNDIVLELINLVKPGSEEDEPLAKKPKSDCRPVDFVEKLGLVASLAILNGRHFYDNLVEMIPLDTVRSLLQNEQIGRNNYFLLAVDFYLTSLHVSGREELFTFEFLTELYHSLGPNLGSANRQTRILTLHMLSLFPLPLPTPPENVTPTPVFETCFQAELVPVGLREHREKLKLLHDLDAQRVVHSLPVGGVLGKAPLRYLLSQLYLNFRPFWDPVLKLVESHAFHMDGCEFWSVYFLLLERIRQMEAEDAVDPTTEVDYLQWGVEAERVDYVNVRCLLWQGLSRFGSMAEKEHARIVPLFLEFWNSEYSASDGSVARSQNLTVTSKTDIEADGEEEAEDGDEGAGKRCDRKKLMQLLTAHLSVFTTFQDASKMTREAEVSAVLYHLLSHRSGELQKLALDCLSNYQLTHLTPYKENFYRLLADKTFRSELTLFSIDSATSVVRPEHRADVTAVLLRLLYGKMQTKAGHNSAGKQSIQQRQALILRYLAGFSDAEIDVFLNLAFQLFLNRPQEEDVYQQVVGEMRDVDPSAALPLKRLQGALVMMGTIFAKLGNLMTSTLPKLLRILLCICAHVAGLVEKRSSLDPKYVSQLKNLRTLSQERVTQFFSKFERYAWTPTEVEALFHVCVWPQLQLLPLEAIHTPTPLLRMFQVWSVNPRYFVLFGKAQPQRPDVSVLPPLLTLLAGGKAQPAVCTFIMDMVEKLLTLADYGTRDAEEDAEMSEEPVFIRPDSCIEIGTAVPATESTEIPNFGSKLLVPHISLILSYIRTIMSRGLNTRDLNILMRVSEFITDSNLSSELAGLIVPAIKAKTVTGRGQGSAASEEILTQYLNSLANLLLTASEPQSFIGVLAPLFGAVDGRSAREALCNSLKIIGQREAACAPLGQLVSSMNAWDPKRVDQQDFDLRLSVHKEVNAVFNGEETPTVDWIYLVLYNCFHFIRKVDDSSLRDSASFSLQLMCAAFKRYTYGKSALNGHFLPQLRLLIRSKKELVRHEGVQILGEAVTHCASMSVALSGLRKLRKTDDLELDFFHNSRHLQTHRRSRALLRMAGILKSDRSWLGGETITQFLLPLTTCYLFDEAYDKHNHLVDAAFDSLQAMARCLSWYNYDKLLRYFLNHMTRQVEFQKQAVKAVVAVLNGFHFDLRNSQFRNISKFHAGATTTITTTLVSTVEEDEPSIVEDTPSADLTAAEFPELADGDQEKVEDKSNLSVEASTRIHAVIVQQLMPQLNKILSARSKRDAQHKFVKDYFPEDDEILRVPIALALVHLLKNLPSGALEHHLPGMFSKVCTFLKSRCDSVRETSRDTLIRMMTALGPQHLRTLLEAAESVLQRGFQVHVYIFTVHAILVKLTESDQLKAGTLDPVVQHIVEICKRELLGETADEKEVAQITSKVKEARGIKAYDTLNIVAKNVSQTSLLPLLLPFKEIMCSTKSFKMMRKVEECLQNIATGLTLNQSLSVAPLLVFVHGVVSLSIPQLKLPEEQPKSSDELFSASGKPKRVDSYIITPAPKRTSAAQPATTKQTSKSAYVTNSHLFVEFGLLTLHLLLKQDKFQEDAIMPMLDPFVPIVNDSLRSQHSKLVALSLRCVCHLLRMPLPSIGEFAPTVSTSIFTLLHKYSGNASGDTYEMIQTAFKAVTVLVEHVKSHMIDTDQLRVLLTYAEQALNDPTQQSIGFGVLKAILRRKLQLEELPEIMFRVAQLSVTSEAAPVRAQCKQVVLKYMIDYPLGKQIRRYLEFFLAQLEYEKEVGRLSAIEFMASIFSAFPKNLLSQQSTFFLTTMSPRLINDTSTSCVKAVVAALRILIQRLNTNTSNVLFEITLNWLKNSNLSLKRLAVQLCGIFATAEGDKFEFRLKELLPELVKLLEPVDYEEENRDLDLLLIQTFYAITKISQYCPNGLRNVDRVEVTDEVWTHIIHHLLHPHVWVRTLSARLVGVLLGWHVAGDVASCVATEEPIEEVRRTYLMCSEHVHSRLNSLASQSVGQLQSGLLDNQLSEQVVKNLIFIAKVANRVPAASQEPKLGDKAPTLPWLTGKLRREINAEVVIRPKFTIKRLSVFKWMAAVARDLHEVGGTEALKAVLKFFVPPLTREINDDGAPEEVRNFAQEVADLVKGLVGTEAYSEAVVAANRSLAVRRRDRNTARKADSVVRPERSAHLKMKKHLAKRVAKKVKIAKIKGKRLKLKDMAFTSA